MAFKNLYTELALTAARSFRLVRILAGDSSRYLLGAGSGRRRFHGIWYVCLTAALAVGISFSAVPKLIAPNDSPYALTKPHFAILICGAFLAGVMLAIKTHHFCVVSVVKS